MAVIDDEPEGDQDDPDLSEIFVANDATAEKILLSLRQHANSIEHAIIGTMIPKLALGLGFICSLARSSTTLRMRGASLVGTFRVKG